jgi:hypothetical protein
MADQRCPFCGKSNPAGASMCQYCQARLKPLVISNPDEPQGLDSIFSQGQEPEDSVPDWLKDLRGPEQEQEAASPEEPDTSPAEAAEESSFAEEASPEPEQAGELDGEMPDWLARIRERSTEEQPPAPVESQEVEIDLSLEEYLAQQESQQSAQEAPEVPPPAVTDWLEAIGRLQREQETQSAAGEPPSVQAGEEAPAGQPPEFPSDEMDSAPVEMSEPDWLQQARSRQVEDIPAEEAQQPEETLSPSAASSEDVADWTTEIGLPEESAALAGDEPPLEAPVSQPAEPQEEEASEEAPAWLAGWGGIFTAQAALEEETPAPEETAAASAAESLSPEDEPDSSVPEWLLNLEAIEIPGAAESTPAFILDQSGENEIIVEPADGSEIAPYTPPGVDGLPDWLAQVSAEEAGDVPAGEEAQSGLEAGGKEAQEGQPGRDVPGSRGQQRVVPGHGG